jgi:hypothetical protein
MTRASQALRVYRCWKCKREKMLTPEQHEQHKRRGWTCRCGGGTLHLHRLEATPTCPDAIPPWMSLAADNTFRQLPCNHCRGDRHDDGDACLTCGGTGFQRKSS